MKKQFYIDFLWIPSDLGGHSGAPYSGMRCEIRWQQHLEDYLKCALDVECQLIAFDHQTSRGRAICMLSQRASPAAKWLQDGEQVELLNGPRVLAVGRASSK
jgi:hypothetical protein